MNEKVNELEDKEIKPKEKESETDTEQKEKNDDADCLGKIPMGTKDLMGYSYIFWSCSVLESSWTTGT